MTKKKKNREATQEPTDTTPAEELKRLREQNGRLMTRLDEAAELLSELKFEIACQADGTIAYGADECVPVVCPSPPTIASSNIQGHTGTVHYEDTVKYVCVQGYSPTGLHTADEDNLVARTIHLPCETNGEFPAALPKCDPNSCGESPMVEHSKKKPDAGVGHFQQPSGMVRYTCNEGYKEPVGPTSHCEAHCQHDGTWLGLPPISCGLPPTRDNTNSIPVVPGSRW